jgi:O-antigen ligase
MAGGEPRVLRRKAHAQQHMSPSAKIQGYSRRQEFLRHLGLLLMAVFCLMACVLVGSSGAILASLATFAATILTYPRYWWPAAALSSTILVPFSYASGNELSSIVTSGTLLMTAYVFTGGGRKANWLRAGLPILAGLLLVYFLVQMPFASSDNNVRKLIWIFLIMAVMIMPPFVTDARATAPPIVRVISISGFIISVFGIIEYVTKLNPLVDFYAAARNPLIQKWGDYRIFTLLGHPLVNALFLALVATVALALFLRLRHVPSLFLLVISSVSLVFTQSRTGIAAMAVGMSMVLLGSPKGETRRRALLASGLIIVAIIAFFQIDNPLMQRNGSAEGQGSSELRFAYLEVLPDLMDASSLWGTGPGLSDSALRDVGGFAASFPIESSVVQWLMSFGVTGFVLFLAIFAAIVVVSWRRSSILGPSLFMAYCVAAAGFNVFEGYPCLIVVPGVLLVMSIAEAEHPRSLADHTGSRRRHVGGDPIGDKS